MNLFFRMQLLRYLLCWSLELVVTIRWRTTIKQCSFFDFNVYFNLIFQMYFLLMCILNSSISSYPYRWKSYLIPTFEGLWYRIVHLVLYCNHSFTHSTIYCHRYLIKYIFIVIFVYKHLNHMKYFYDTKNE